MLYTSSIEIKRIVQLHRERYPLMEEEDVVKLVYQGQLGGGHHISSREQALRLLPRGGYLATCSCSHFMPAERLARVVAEAAHNAGVQLRQIEERQQAPDHPILVGMPESSYLKFFLYQVV